MLDKQLLEHFFVVRNRLENNKYKYFVLISFTGKILPIRNLVNCGLQIINGNIYRRRQKKVYKILGIYAVYFTFKPK